MTISGEQTNQPALSKPTLAFRWGYIALPVSILLLSIILAAIFSPKLQPEIGYHFKDDGSPDRWLGRSQLVLAMLLPQLLLTLLAGVITWGVSKLSARFRPPGQSGIKTEKTLRLMGNMVALPQIMLGFAMLDIFRYNSSQIHIMPFWVFAVLVMGIGGILLGVFFLRAIREGWRATQ